MNNLNIEILEPNIFPNKEIISGVTKRNLENFQPIGFTISPVGNKIVNQHRILLSKKLNISISKMKFQKQIHSDIIKIVDDSTPNDQESDGMITNVKGLILNVSLADCTGILIYDRLNKVIAAIHSGWRGTKLNIATKTISLLKEKFKSNPDDLLVYLTPSASGKNYEVDWDVAQHFPNFAKKIKNGKYLYDNSSQIKQQLIFNGVKESNIEHSTICTIENKEFHSYRRDKDKSGRMSAFIGMI